MIKKRIERKLEDRDPIEYLQYIDYLNEINTNYKDKNLHEILDGFSDKNDRNYVDFFNMLSYINSMFVDTEILFNFWSPEMVHPFTEFYFSKNEEDIPKYIPFFNKDTWFYKLFQLLKYFIHFYIVKPVGLFISYNVIKLKTFYLECWLIYYKSEGFAAKGEPITEEMIQTVVDVWTLIACLCMVMLWFIFFILCYFYFRFLYNLFMSVDHLEAFLSLLDVLEFISNYISNLISNFLKKIWDFLKIKANKVSNYISETSTWKFLIKVWTFLKKVGNDISETYMDLAMILGEDSAIYWGYKSGPNRAEEEWKLKRKKKKEEKERLKKLEMENKNKIEEKKSETTNSEKN